MLLSAPTGSVARVPSTVLVVGQFNVEAFGLHISEALERLGARVVRFHVGIKTNELAGVARKRVDKVRKALGRLTSDLPYARARLTRRLRTLAREHAVDLTIVCHDFLLPDDVALLRDSTERPVVLWFPDHIANFGRTQFLASPYDALFFKDPYVVAALRRLLAPGKHIYYLPECCSAVRHRPVSLEPHEVPLYQCDIATAGNLYPYRAAVFAQLARYHVRIWGNPAPLWMSSAVIRGMAQNRYVAYETKAKAFAGAKIVVNSVHPAEIWGVNARAFEIPAVGGFELIDWRPALHDLFVDGEELVTFGDRNDLYAKLDYYLSNDELRRRIAARGTLRAHRDHTYENRLSLLLDTLGEAADGYVLPTQSIPAAPTTIHAGGERMPSAAPNIPHL